MEGRESLHLWRLLLTTGTSCDIWMLRVFEMDGRHAVSTFGYHLLVGKLLKLGEGMICDSFLRATRALFHRGVFLPLCG